MEPLSNCAVCGKLFCGVRVYKGWRRRRLTCSTTCKALLIKQINGQSAWAAERDALIKDLMGDLSDVEIAALVGTSKKAIGRRRRSTGLLREQLPFLPWTELETALIEDMAPIMTNRELSDLLDRPESSIASRLNRRGFKRPPSFYLERGWAYPFYPPELKQSITLLNKLRKALVHEEHRRSA